MIDVRSKQAYAAGHVSNAVSVEPGACLADPGVTARWLGQLGVTHATVVVVYDENGGPAAACTWWRIRRAGHSWVLSWMAAGNGGLRKAASPTRWIPETRWFPGSNQPIIHLSGCRRFAPLFPPPVRSCPLDPGVWSWQHTLDETGFRNYEELLRLADSRNRIKLAVGSSSSNHATSPSSDVTRSFAAEQHGTLEPLCLNVNSVSTSRGA